jgi:Zn-dependent peptidase ImmA (M78 family)
LGLFHASEGLVFLNQSLMAVKKRFVGFHEAGHGFLPWQRPMYAIVEDCEKALDGATADLFDREANAFASEVLFQLDTFREMTEGEPFEIWTPVNVARRFNASNYAAIRQYVSKNHRACALSCLTCRNSSKAQDSERAFAAPSSPKLSRTFSVCTLGKKFTRRTTISAPLSHLVVGGHPASAPLR